MEDEVPTTSYIMDDFTMNDYLDYSKVDSVFTRVSQNYMDEMNIAFEVGFVYDSYDGYPVHLDEPNITNAELEIISLDDRITDYDFSPEQDGNLYRGSIYIHNPIPGIIYDPVVYGFS